MYKAFYTGIFFGIIYVVYCLCTFIFGTGFQWEYMIPFAFLLLFAVLASGEGDGQLFTFLISANIPVLLLISLIFFINEKLSGNGKGKEKI